MTDRDPAMRIEVNEDGQHRTFEITEVPEGGR
jgi:hypothetical protein